MQKNEPKKIDKILKQNIQKLGLDSPSSDFTASVMQKVSDLKESKSIVYDPLISKTVWYVIFTCISFILIYVTFNIDSSSSSLLSLTDLYNQTPSISMPKLTISNTITNSIIAIGILFLIQIPLLKHYFNKRII